MLRPRVLQDLRLWISVILPLVVLPTIFLVKMVEHKLSHVHVDAVRILLVLFNFSPLFPY